MAYYLFFFFYKHRPINDLYPYSPSTHVFFSFMMTYLEAHENNPISKTHLGEDTTKWFGTKFSNIIVFKKRLTDPFSQATSSYSVTVRIIDFSFEGLTHCGEALGKISVGVVVPVGKGGGGGGGERAVRTSKTVNHVEPCRWRVFSAVPPPRRPLRWIVKRRWSSPNWK